MIQETQLYNWATEHAHRSNNNLAAKLIASFVESWIPHILKFGSCQVNLKLALWFWRKYVYLTYIHDGTVYMNCEFKFL